MNAKSVKMVVANAREAIAKAQDLLEKNDVGSGVGEEDDGRTRGCQE